MFRQLLKMVGSEKSQLTHWLGSVEWYLWCSLEMACSFEIQSDEEAIFSVILEMWPGEGWAGRWDYLSVSTE